jgi:hypothetical protein
MKRTTALLTVMVLVASGLSAQRPQTRSGFWINLGVGNGSLGCENCDGRTSAVSGQLALGGTLSDKLLLGGSINNWTKEEGGLTLSASTVTAMVRFYPSATGGFFLSGGLGLATTSANIDIGAFGFENELFLEDNGVGALIGAGYDIRVGRNISITPFFNGYGMYMDGGNLNVVQVGVGMTIH